MLWAGLLSQSWHYYLECVEGEPSPLLPSSSGDPWSGQGEAESARQGEEKGGTAESLIRRGSAREMFQPHWQEEEKEEEEKEEKE